MGFLGGSRIDGITVFLVTFLIIYSILVAGVTATFSGEEFINPYIGSTIDIGEIGGYETSEAQNISRPVFSTSVFYTKLNPDGRLDWNNILASSTFSVYRQGVDWWDGWVYYEQEPLSITEEKIIEDFDSSKNFTRVFYNRGGKIETTVFYCPLFFYNDTSKTVTYIYDGIEESFENDEITVVFATNMTYTGFDIGRVFGLLMGFSTYDMPAEVGYLVSGVFWGLLVLTVVKLVLG